MEEQPNKELPQQTDTGQRIITREIENDMKDAYLTYAMSAIIGRALPDVRDGLKPVHRRILYAMNDMGISATKPYKKCARIVGEVLGKYHPHGDTAVYDSLVRMVQDFSLRYPLIDGQGNFGDIDGDRAAAMRYTEARMKKEAEELLTDIEKETVDFRDNFDGSLQEPIVLPSKIPNLLVNGSTGIAVGMATNIPPHNMGEVCRACIEVLKNPEIESEQLLEHVSGPDFPTGGIILGTNGIRNAYLNGRGKVKLRAKVRVEELKNKQALIVDEIPYQVNKSSLLEQIADLVKDKRITGISDIRDESDRDGMRIVIELKGDAHHEVITNQLYKYSRMQTTFGIINLAIVDGQPKVLSLKGMIGNFLKHRREIIVKRTQYDLNKAEARAHIVEGLLIALSHIDEIITLIKSSNDAAKAREALMSSYTLSEKQSQAILDMRLQRLTALEQDKLKNEHNELLAKIADLKNILENDSRVKAIIQEELTELTQKYTDTRKTDIIIGGDDDDIDMEDLIDKEDMVITITNSGYIKRLPLDTYKQQKRGGKGIIATGTKEEDFVTDVFIANTHDYLLFFTDKGVCHWKKVYHIPQASRQARGSAIVNMLDIPKEEKVAAYIPVSEFKEDHYLTMVTKKGIVKKTALDAYSKPRKGGIIAINLTDGDELITAKLTDGTKQLLIATKNGMANKFNEQDVRAVGRNSIGVKGITLKETDEVVGMVLAPDHLYLSTITEHGYGKRTRIADYRLTKRGSSGVINIIANDRNGPVVGVEMVDEKTDLLFISKKGIVIRTPAKGISIIGRNTQGMRLMKLADTDQVMSSAKIVSEEEEEQIGGEE